MDEDRLRTIVAFAQSAHTTCSIGNIALGMVREMIEELAHKDHESISHVDAFIREVGAANPEKADLVDTCRTSKRKWTQEIEIIRSVRRLNGR